MNREILFRGKRVDNGKWIYDNIVFTRSGRAFKLEGSFFTGETHEGNFERGEIYGTEVIPKTVGRYTGLTDKNGRKIFEGDVVKNVENGKIGRASYLPEHCGFMIYCKSDNCYYWLFDNDFKKIEVIGNIHDNPELLGTEE